MSATVARPRTRKQRFADQFSEEEREAYKRAQREEAKTRLEDQLASLQTSEGFRQWLTVRARFRQYSFANQMLIKSQCPEATRVAPAPVWRKMGRYPVKGSHALKVWVLMDWHKQTGAHPGEIDQYGNVAFACDQHKRVCVSARQFKLGPVFDISQTDGEEIPPAPEPAPIDGDSHAHLVPKLIALADQLGYTVADADLEEGNEGSCNYATKQITLRAGQSANSRVRTLVHEIAHALGIGYKEFGRGAAEVIVDSATYVVCAGAGLDVSAATVPYVAGWGRGNATDQLREFAERIDDVARTIERAL